VETLKTVRVVDIDLGDGQQKRSVTHGTARAPRVLITVGIRNLDPDASKTNNKAA
jgi:hypothetical protein